VEGIGGFFRFAQMRGEGKTVEEILREMNKGAQDDFQKGKERIRSVLQRAFNDRKEDGEIESVKLCKFRFLPKKW
jgi:hypothetical protein